MIEVVLGCGAMSMSEKTIRTRLFNGIVSFNLSVLTFDCYIVLIWILVVAKIFILMVDIPTILFLIFLF